MIQNGKINDRKTCSFLSPFRNEPFRLHCSFISSISCKWHALDTILSETEGDAAGFYAAFFGEGVRDALWVVQEAQYLCLIPHIGKVSAGVSLVSASVEDGALLLKNSSKARLMRG